MPTTQQQGLRPFADAQRVRQELMRRLPRVAKARGCSMSMLRALDDACRSVDELSEPSPQDAAEMAKALLGVLQRLAWVQVSGKVDAAPAPATVPLKLWNRGAISRAARQQLDRANALPATKGNAEPLVRACRSLMIWIADDSAAPMFADGEDILVAKVNTSVLEQSSLIERLRKHAADEGLADREAAGAQELKAAEVTA